MMDRVSDEISGEIEHVHIISICTVESIKIHIESTYHKSKSFLL